MQYPFRQQHFLGLIQHRLDYNFISHIFQEMVKDSKILRAMSADHLAPFCSFQDFKGSGRQKFKNSLGSNKDFIQKSTEHSQKVQE